MEEKALIINIATILGKDMILDQKNNFKKPMHSCPTAKAFTGLLADDDEGFDFFIRNFVKNPDKNCKRTLDTHPKQMEPNEPTPKVVKQNPPSRINLIQDLETSVFESNLHMNKNTFQKLHTSIAKMIKPLYTNNTVISSQTIFSLGLWKLATDEHFEEISRRFKIPLAACHLIIRNFWSVISDNYEKFIKWPNTRKTQEDHMRSFEDVASLKKFPILFGVIAVKRLDIFLESADEERSVILQIVCDGNQSVIDCYVDFAESYSFTKSPVGHILETETTAIPAGSYLIGGHNFPLRRYLIRPFELECFRDESRFNEVLQKAEEHADCVLNKMVRRFNTLYALEARDLQEVRKILETICSLHNLCQEFADECIPNSSERSEKYIVPEKVNENNAPGRKRRLEIMDKVLKTSSSMKDVEST